MFTHLGIPKVCSHIREVEFDSQCAPSNATSGRLGSELVFGSALSRLWLRSYDSWPIPYSILPLKLDWLAVESPRSVVNYCSLLAPKAFVKISNVYMFVLMCCRLTSLARTCSQIK